MAVAPAAQSIYGIKAHASDLKDMLSILSRSDFKHDFETVSMRDIIDKIEISKNKKSRIPFQGQDRIIKSIKAKIPRGEETTVYKHFKDTNILIPDEAQTETTEDDVVNNIIKLHYEDLKKSLIVFASTQSQIEALADKNLIYNEAEFKILNQDIPVSLKNIIVRKYKRTVYPTKVKGQYLNLPVAFKKTSGKKKFVLILDNSFFSISTMRRTIRNTIMENDTYDPNDKYEFYILENNENRGDSGVKINKFDDGELIEGTDKQRVEIFLLKESPQNRCIYPSRVYDACRYEGSCTGSCKDGYTFRG